MLVLGLLWRFQAVECILCPFSLPGLKLFGGVLCAVGVQWGLGLGGGGCWDLSFLCLKASPLGQNQQEP